MVYHTKVVKTVLFRLLSFTNLFDIVGRHLGPETKPVDNHWLGETT